MPSNRNSGSSNVYTLDLNFLGIPGAIAAYLIPHRHGAILIESGPGSTIEDLQMGLHSHGYASGDITDVLLTHIHLDHAGAAGWLARQGARIHVHKVGAPHLSNPEKLIASASRIYGDMMDRLWGEVLPVPTGQLNAHNDRDVIEVEGLCFRAVDSPGHAYHHFVYLFEDICFSGDICGVRMAQTRHLRLPMPPPEFHLEKWRESLDRLRLETFARIAPTHFGIYEDPGFHLSATEKALDEVEDWMEQILPTDPPLEQLNEAFLEWINARSISEGLDPGFLELYEAATPSWMSVQGIHRYWKKYRSQTG